MYKLELTFEELIRLRGTIIQNTNDNEKRLKILENNCPAISKYTKEVILKNTEILNKIETLLNM